MFVTAGMLRKYVTGALRHLHILGQEGNDCGTGNEGVEPLAYGSFRSVFPYDFVLVDEVHERTVDCDMALLLLKCLAVKITAAAVGRIQLPIFRIVVMSATISASDFAAFLAGESLNMFQAEQAAWRDQTLLLRVKGDLQGAQHVRDLIMRSAASGTEGLSDVLMHQCALRKRERLIRWAKALSTSLNELAHLWKNRRSRDMLAVFREQQASMTLSGSPGRQQWRKISGTAYVKGNCVEVARQTNFPVEELFWDDLRDLATMPLTSNSAQLLDVASPALLRLMGIESVAGDSPPFSASGGMQYGATDERKTQAAIASDRTGSSGAHWQEDNSFQWEDDEYQLTSRADYCFDKPRLDHACVEGAARMLLLIHTQCLLRNVPQCGVLVFLPGRSYVVMLSGRQQHTSAFL